MGATLATVSSLLKEVYEPSLQKQLNDECVAMKRIERTSEGVTNEVGGKYVTFPIKTRRNAGIGARNELEALPTPGQQGYNAARVGLKYLYGGIQLSGQTIELADSNFQAFVSALDQEVEGLKTDLLKDQNRQFYADGSGLVAKVGTAGTTVNTLTVVDPMWVQMGMQFDLIDGTTLGNPSPTVKISNRQVTGINTTTGVVTFDGAAASSAVGDVMVRTGNVNREWTGLSKIINDSGTLYNVDPTVEPVWKSYVDQNGGTLRSLSEGLMILAADTIRTNGAMPTAMFSNLGVRRAYWQLLVQQRQYVNTKDFGGGFTGLSFTTDKGEIPFVADVDCPKSTIFMVNEQAIKLYRQTDWEFMDRDGSKWQRVITSAGSFDAYSATMYQYSELGTHRRNSHGVIKDLIEG